MNLTQLKDTLKGVSTTKQRKKRKTLIQKFIDKTEISDIEYHRDTYKKILIILNEKRHVTETTTALLRQGISISESEVNLYFQIGRVINGLNPITPSEYIRKLNEKQPLPKPKKHPRIAGIMKKLTSVKFPPGRSHGGESEREYK